jgi:hypothetical protein
MISSSLCFSLPLTLYGNPRQARDTKKCKVSPLSALSLVNRKESSPGGDVCHVYKDFFPYHLLDDSLEMSVPQCFHAAKKSTTFEL